MILGIGTDILEIDRLKKAFVKTPTLVERVYTIHERCQGDNLSKIKKIAFYAKRFAAKEAIAKACGTGIGEKISWQDIEIKNTENGQPIAIFSKRTTAFLKKKFKVRNINISLSLSDEKKWAVAFAVLESKN